jgi:hypothetical protein
MIGLLVLKMGGRRLVDPQAVFVMGDNRAELLADAAHILDDARTDGRSVSRRALAAQWRERGHRFSNETLHDIAVAAELEDLAV